MTVISGNVRYAQGWVADTTNVTIEIDEEGNEIHRRDFRQNILGPTNPLLFVEAEVAVDGNTYQLAFTRPNVGYRAFFIEVSFEGRESGNEDTDFNFTTEVQIIPDSLPWDRCVTEEICQGILK